MLCSTANFQLGLKLGFIKSYFLVRLILRIEEIVEGDNYCRVNPMASSREG
jgi:hypothetical protein